MILPYFPRIGSLGNGRIFGDVPNSSSSDGYGVKSEPIGDNF